MKELLGIDVGATGIKRAMVNMDSGELASARIKISTPDSKKPDAIINVINEIINSFDQKGNPVGIGFPSIIKNGISKSASNIDNSWINYPAKQKIEKATGCPVTVINDADAAGLAEMKFGVGQNESGTVILLTLGTGIGSAFLKNGSLLENTELGQMIYEDKIAEYYASNSARKRENMSWEEYGAVLNKFLTYVNLIFNPDLIILGGGISKKFDLYSKEISDRIRILPAEKYNNAGIIGSALSWDIYGKKEKAVNN